jgi:outer membrane protein assembly factor BamB
MKKSKIIIFQSFILILVLMILPATAETTTDETWHQFHKDAAHTGSQVEGPGSNQLAWMTDNLNATGDSSVVIAENKVFVNCKAGASWSSGNAWVKALNINDGTLEWSTQVDSVEYSSWSSPAYNNSCIFTSTGEYTTCIYANNGSVKWTFENPTGLPSCNGGPSVADGKVFCSDWYGHYYCLNEVDGVQLWNFSTFDNGGSELEGARSQATPAYKDGYVYLTSYCYQYTDNGTLKQGYVYCVDANTGVEQWGTTLEQNACGSVACGDDGYVYVSTYNFYGNGATYALDANTGAIVWEKETLRTDSTPALAYGNVYVSGGYYNGKVYCFNGSTGETIWETDSSYGLGSWTNSVSIADGKVYVGGKSSEMFGSSGLYALDALTGDIYWKGNIGGSSPSIYNGELFTISSSSVYCYDGSNVYVDLEPETPSLATQSLYTDTQNEITATIKNTGTTYSGDNVKVSFLVDGTEISNQTIDGIPGGMSETLTFIWEPTESQAGQHTLYIRVDPQNLIAETNENNNLLPKTVNVLSGSCDLQPSSLTPSEVYIGNTYEMTVCVDNTGYKPSDVCNVVIKEGTNTIDEVELPSVSPGLSQEISFSWTPLTSGDVTLTVIVDMGEVVDEVSELNNELGTIITVNPETEIETISDDDWTQFQNGWMHCGDTVTYAPTDDSINLVWSADLSGELIDCPPIVVGDIVYTYTSEGTLYAYDKNDGSYLWDKGLESVNIQSCTPAYGDGNIFVASYGGNLSAYDSETGNEQWSVEVTDEGFQSPVIYYDHRIYIGDGLGAGVGTKYFHCYDDLGNHLWSYENTDSAGFLWNGASIIGDYVVYPTHEGKLVCLDRIDGTLVDEISLDSDVDSRISFANETPGLFRSSVVYEDGYIYTTSEQGQDLGFLWKVGFDSSSGSFLNTGWNLMQGFSTSTPVIYDGRIYVGMGEHGYSGKLNCVDDHTGELIWSYDVPEGVKSSPAVSTYYDTPFIYFTSAMENSSLYCLDVNGTLIWEYNPPGDDEYVLQGAAVSQGKVYYGTDGGYLYCLENDWNIFNDALSDSGNYVVNSEIQLAVIKWKNQSPLPSNHLISSGEIQTMVIKWKNQSPM